MTITRLKKARKRLAGILKKAYHDPSEGWDDDALSILLKFPTLAGEYFFYYYNEREPKLPILLFVSTGSDLQHVKAVHDMHPHLFDSKDEEAEEAGDLSSIAYGMPRMDVLLYLLDVHPELKTTLDPTKVGYVLYKLIAGVRCEAGDHANLEALVSELLDLSPNCCSWYLLHQAHLKEGLSDSVLDKLAENMPKKDFCHTDGCMITVNGMIDVRVTEHYRRALKRLLPQLEKLHYDHTILRYDTDEDFIELMNLITTHGNNLQELAITLPRFLLIESSIARQSLACLLQQAQMKTILLTFETEPGREESDGAESEDESDYICPDLNDNVVIKDIGEAMWHRDTPIDRLDLSGFRFKEGPNNVDGLLRFILAPNTAINLQWLNCCIECTEFVVESSDWRPSLKSFLFDPNEVSPSFFGSIIDAFAQISTLESLSLPTCTSTSDDGAPDEDILELVRQNKQLKSLKLDELNVAALGNLWDILRDNTHSLEQFDFALLGRTGSAATPRNNNDSSEPGGNNGNVVFEKGLLDLLRTSNTTLKCCYFRKHDDDPEIHGSARSWPEENREALCRQVSYYLELNVYGRKAAREASNMLVFVNLLSRVIQDDGFRGGLRKDSGLKYHPQDGQFYDPVSRWDKDTEAMRTSYVYGLLREQPVFWSTNQNDNDALPSPTKRRKTAS